MTHGAGVASAPESYPRARWGSLEVAREVDGWLLTHVWRCGLGEASSVLIPDPRRPFIGRAMGR
jgi:hypothetical protein